MEEMENTGALLTEIRVLAASAGSMFCPRTVTADAMEATNRAGGRSWSQTFFLRCLVYRIC